MARLTPISAPESNIVIRRESSHRHTLLLIIDPNNKHHHLIIRYSLVVLLLSRMRVILLDHHQGLKQLITADSGDRGAVALDSSLVINLAQIMLIRFLTLVIVFIW